MTLNDVTPWHQFLNLFLFNFINILYILNVKASWHVKWRYFSHLISCLFCWAHVSFATEILLFHILPFIFDSIIFASGIKTLRKPLKSNRSIQCYFLFAISDFLFCLSPPLTLPIHAWYHRGKHLHWVDSALVSCRTGPWLCFVSLVAPLFELTFTIICSLSWYPCDLVAP